MPPPPPPPPPPLQMKKTGGEGALHLLQPKQACILHHKHDIYTNILWQQCRSNSHQKSDRACHRNRYHCLCSHGILLAPLSSNHWCVQRQHRFLEWTQRHHDGEARTQYIFYLMQLLAVTSVLLASPTRAYLCHHHLWLDMREICKTVLINKATAVQCETSSSLENQIATCSAKVIFILLKCQVIFSMLI